MSDFFIDLLPVGTLVLGWALNELHQLVSSRQEHGSSIRRALAYLLEVRFQLRAIEFFIVEIKRRSPQAQAQMPHLRSFLETIIGGESQINEKYEAAIQVIAARDPFLAFDLTSRSKVSTFFQNWRNLAIASGAPSEELETAEADLKQLLGPKFDETILSVAGKLSWLSKRRTKRILSSPFELPSELSKMLDKHIPSQSG